MHARGQLLLTNVQELEYPLDHGEAVTDIPVPDQQLLDMFLDCVHPKLRAVIQTRITRGRAYENARARA